MARDRHYIPGTFYRICDRTGQKIRSYDTRKEWDGLIVKNEVWEPRQPQDYVRGVRDEQVVPEARPRPANIYAVAETFLTACSPAGSNVLYVDSTAGFQPYGAFLQVMLDNGSTFFTRFYAAPSGATTTEMSVYPALPAPAGCQGFANTVLLLTEYPFYEQRDDGSYITDDSGNRVPLV